MELRTVSELQASTATSGKKPNELGQRDFMALMLAQLKSQDPFKPMDNTQFVAQMAQFSTLSGISEMNTSFATLAESMQSAQLLNATSLIGKDAVIAADFARLSAGGSVNGQVELPAGSQSVAVEITNIAGQVVRRLELGAHGAGAVNFSWDGRSNSGDALPPGQYMIRASFFNGSNAEALDTYIKAGIDSVSVPAGGGSPLLNVDGLGTVRLSDVKEIG